MKSIIKRCVFALFLCIAASGASAQSITEIVMESYIKYYNLSTSMHHGKIVAICPHVHQNFYDDWSNEVFGFSRGTTTPGVTTFSYSDSVCLPLKGSLRLTSPFGYRDLYKDGKIEFHRGVDFSLNSENKDTVYSVFCGVVRFTADYGEDSFGKVIVVRNCNGSETLYAHLYKILVVNNQEVGVGVPIAIGGNSGRSTGPHLHFEIQYHKNPFNPITNGKFLNKIAIH
jgi:murein DD-endopeptidase MepM/ murein hydrolase activator NlpD